MSKYTYYEFGFCWKRFVNFFKLHVQAIFNWLDLIENKCTNSVLPIFLKLGFLEGNLFCMPKCVRRTGIFSAKIGLHTLEVPKEGSDT